MRDTTELPSMENDEPLSGNAENSCDSMEMGMYGSSGALLLAELDDDDRFTSELPIAAFLGSEVWSFPTAWVKCVDNFSLCGPWSQNQNSLRMATAYRKGLEYVHLE